MTDKMMMLTGTATLVIDGTTVTAPISLPVDVTQLAAAIAPLLPAPVVTPPVVTPPVVTPPAAGIPKLDYVIYQNGAGNLLDDSWTMQSINYQDTSGQPQGGNADISVTLAGPNGGWQPLFVPNGSTSFFDLSPYQYLLLSIKPTTDGANYWIGFAGNKDTADGSQIQVAGPGMTTYGPAPVKGQWNNLKIPLTAFKLSDAKAVFKFGVACGNFPAGTVSYFDNVGLTKA